MTFGSLIPFSEAVVDATGGNAKIQRKEYLSAGLLPIIDQGQEDIAGYTDEAEAAYQGELPVVLFGDHTRAFKYVDAPFALGADGVKVLAPRPGFNAKFLYYYFRSCDMPSRGYSRHFKYLREISVPHFAPSEQRRIVELLDQAEALRRLRRAADAKAARILPALFLKMFGDPSSNPMGWAMKAVGDVLASADYGSSTRASDDGKGLPLIRMGNVSYAGNLLLDDLKFVELSDADAKKYRLEEGDILFNRTNSLDLVGKTGIWGGEMDAVVASYFIRLRVDSGKIDPVFLWAYMNCSYMKRVLRATARGAIGQANINTNELRAFPLYLPPPEKQKEFVRKVGIVKESLPTATEKCDLDYLFEVLQRRAFSGELTAKWRQAHMTELLAEMRQQAKVLNLPLAGNSA